MQQSSTSNMKVLIPSKGRAKNLHTIKHFDPEDVFVFVQIDELDEYRKHNPDLKIVAHCRPTGVSNARNAILEWAEDNDIKKFFMMDDDIRQIGEFNPKKYKDFPGRKTHTGGYDATKDIPKFVKEVEDLLDKYAAVSIPMSGFARLMSGLNEDRVKENSASVFAVFALNLDKIRGLRYDTDLRVGEDHDFTVQMLFRNENVCVDYMYAYVGDHKVPGGCFEDWNEYRKDDLADKLTEKWGRENFIIPKDDKNLIRINFKKLLKNRQNGSTN